jgi:ankyrin repeat protein
MAEGYHTDFVKERDIIAIKYLAKRRNTKALCNIKFNKELVQQKDMSGDSLLHILAEEGYIHLLPKETMTKENLGLRDKDQNTVLHIVAQKGQLRELPRKLITKEGLLERNSEGNTPIHFAAMGGNLGVLPKDVMKLENILIPNNEGETSLHLSVYFKKTNTIPEEFLKNETITVCDKAGNTLLHTAAGANELKSIPKSLMSIENISRTNNQGETVAHIAAKNLCLNDIPDEYLTAGLMASKSSDGSTPLRLGCQYLNANSLAQFTPKQLTPPFLTITDKKGVAPIDIISEGNLHLLPLSSLTGELLLWQKPAEKPRGGAENSRVNIESTPLKNFCNRYQEKQIHTLNYICNLMDANTLKSMKIENKDARTTINEYIMKKSLKRVVKEEETISI